jgi:hypothetical protein
MYSLFVVFTQPGATFHNSGHLCTESGSILGDIEGRVVFPLNVAFQIRVILLSSSSSSLLEALRCDVTHQHSSACPLRLQAPSNKATPRICKSGACVHSDSLD